MPDLLDQLSSRPEKCKCGWEHGGFHICVDLSEPESEQKVIRRMSKSQKENISRTQSERWQQYREDTADRDAKVVERYKQGGIGYPGLAEEFGISKTTVVKIMREAKQRGLVTPRPRGTTVAKGAI